VRILAALAICLTLAPAAMAQDKSPTPQQKEQALRLMDIGDAKAKDKNWQEALDAYKAADDIMGVPTTGIAAAKAYVELGRLVAAHELLRRVARYEAQNPPKAFVAARAEAVELAEKIAARIPSITIKVSEKPKDLRVTVDDAPIEVAGLGFPLPVDVGAHTVVASAPGFVDAKESATVAEKETKTVELFLAPDPNYKAAPPPPPVGPTITNAVPTLPPAGDDGPRVPAWAWAGYGVGAAGLLGGGIAGGIALSKKGSLGCGGTVFCKPDQQSAIDSVKAASTASTILFVVGGVGAAVGIAGTVYGLTRDGAKDKTSWTLTPRVGLASVGLEGTF
jgi:hypothetical protein